MNGQSHFWCQLLANCYISRQKKTGCRTRRLCTYCLVEASRGFEL